MLNRALSIVTNAHPPLYPYEVNFDELAITYIADLADGDGRIALNMLEVMLQSAPDPTDSNDITNISGSKSVSGKQQRFISRDDVQMVLKRTHMLYDRLGDAHYDTISALHKSVRGSDADAALFYVTKMLRSGEDPLYVARRMIRMASEDIGLADDSCLPFAVAAYQAVQQVGMPEADVILAHCAVKLARAKKSVMVYRGMNKVKRELQEEPELAASEIPIHLRNAPTKLMKQLDYGKEYKYNPDYEEGEKVDQTYMPKGFEGKKFLSKKHLGSDDL